MKVASLLIALASAIGILWGAWNTSGRIERRNRQDIQDDPPQSVSQLPPRLKIFAKVLLIILGLVVLFILVWIGVVILVNQSN